MNPEFKDINGIRCELYPDGKYYPCYQFFGGIRHICIKGKWVPDDTYAQIDDMPGDSSGIEDIPDIPDIEDDLDDSDVLSKVVRGLLIAMLILGLFAGGVFVVNNVDIGNLLPDSTSDYGTLQVTSNPSGLEVALDGEYLGVTPLYRSDIKEGHYSISLIDGVAQPLEIVAGETTHVNLVGDSHSSGTSGGSMSITLKPDVRASVYVDGEYHGVTTNSEPLTVTGISAGNHVLLIRANGYADLEYPFTSDGKSKQNVGLSLSIW